MIVTGPLWDPGWKVERVPAERGIENISAGVKGVLLRIIGKAASCGMPYCVGDLWVQLLG